MKNNYFIISIITIFLSCSNNEKSVKQPPIASVDPIDLYQITDSSGVTSVDLEVTINKKYNLDTMRIISSHILSKLDKNKIIINIKYQLVNDINIRNVYAKLSKNSTLYKLEIINNSDSEQRNNSQENISDANYAPISDKQEGESKTNIVGLYSIIKENKGQTNLDNFKIEYLVRINTELEKETLDLIANYIKSKAPSDRPYVFVSFYLPNMTLGAGHYALSRRTPKDNDTKIYLPKANSIPKPSIDKNAEIVGSWRMNFGTTYIYKKNGSLYMTDVFTDGSESTEKLKITTRHNRKGYCYVEDGRELYVISNGNLYVYDEFGDLGAVFSPN